MFSVRSSTRSTSKPTFFSNASSSPAGTKTNTPTDARVAISALVIGPVKTMGSVNNKRPPGFQDAAPFGENARSIGQVVYCIDAHNGIEAEIFEGMWLGRIRLQKTGALL